MAVHSLSFGFLFSILLLLSLPYLFSFKMLEVSKPFVASEKATPLNNNNVPMVLNEKQQLLVGKWAHETVENADAFLKRIGIGIILRQVAKVQRPVFKLTYNGEQWHLYIESAFKNHDYAFVIGERFVQTTIDGRKFWCTTTLSEDGVQIDHQEIHEDEPKNIPAVSKRWVDENGKLIIVEECDGVVSRRTFTRVE